MKKLSRDIQHYTPLLGILAAGIIGFALFSYDRMFQTGIVLASAAAYVTWGLIHHFIHKDLHISIIVEYITIATLGVIIVMSVLFRT